MLSECNVGINITFHYSVRVRNLYQLLGSKPSLCVCCRKSSGFKRWLPWTWSVYLHFKISHFMSPNIFCYGSAEWKFQINGRSNHIESAFFCVYCANLLLLENCNTVGLSVTVLHHSEFKHALRTPFALLITVQGGEFSLYCYRR